MGYEHLMYIDICLELTHVYDRHVFRCVFLEVSTHLYSTDTLSLAHTHWRTRKGAAMAKECKPDCVHPPPHRGVAKKRWLETKLWRWLESYEFIPTSIVLKAHCLFG